MDEVAEGSLCCGDKIDSKIMAALLSLILILQWTVSILFSVRMEDLDIHNFKAILAEYSLRYILTV